MLGQSPPGAGAALPRVFRASPCRRAGGRRSGGRNARAGTRRAASRSPRRRRNPRRTRGPSPRTRGSRPATRARARWRRGGRSRWIRASRLTAPRTCPRRCPPRWSSRAKPARRGSGRPRRPTRGARRRVAAPPPSRGCRTRSLPAAARGVLVARAPHATYCDFRERPDTNAPRSSRNGLKRSN